RYADAWPMLSDNFRKSLGVTTLKIYTDEWEKSGHAELLALKSTHVASDSAIFVLDLHYPKGPVTHKIRYEYVRDQVTGHSRFGHWLFEKGNFIN
ncbi:MAG: hypothetical protein ACK2T5_11070, partial [Anaerolineales bacterium]